LVALSRACKNCLDPFVQAHQELSMGCAVALEAQSASLTEILCYLNFSMREQLVVAQIMRLLFQSVSLRGFEGMSLHIN
jgi:hypothetical protein